ncbi:MAG TPA: hypothetical protein VF814_04660 [Casimicrobiaceae bacterium]
MSSDGRYDPEQLARGYRYYKALEHQRRGFVVIVAMIREYLEQRRWELRQPEQLEGAALELTAKLIAAGAVTLYQAGINEEAWREHQERERRLNATARAAELRAAANEARDEERRRVDERLAELEQERNAENWERENRRKLEQLEREELERVSGVRRITDGKR